MGSYRKSRATARLGAMAFLVLVIAALTAAADDQLELKSLVGKWVWDHKPTGCVTCQPFTITLSITAVSPDGRMKATYQSPKAPNGVPAWPRATMTGGKINVVLKVGPIAYNLDYAKEIDSLRGPVDGFPPALQIRDATFLREK